MPVSAVALVTAVGLPAGVVTVGVVIAVVVAVGAIPIVGALVGVAPGVFVAVGVLTTVGVTVAVSITVGVTGGRVVAVGVTTDVGVTVGGVDDGFGLGVTVTPGVGVLRGCVGVAEACRAGTLVCPLPSVILTCGVCPFTLVGLARQGMGVTVDVGATTTCEVATEVGTVAVTNAELTTCVPSPLGCARANSDPHAPPTVTKSRDILMHMQKKVMAMTIKRPPTPRFHRAINVSIIFSYPSPQIFFMCVRILASPAS